MRKFIRALVAIFIIALGLVGSRALALAAPKESAASTERPPPPAKGRHPTLHGVVNLNTADEAALEMLPGVGPAKSKRIVEHRKGHPFHKAEDLTRVKGFGRKSLARLRPYLVVSGPTTLGEEAPAAAK
jgi:competence protein ComEA